MSFYDKHIHIVGCLPRSGTTLMTELMVTCFEIDGYTEHEQSIFREYLDPCEILCTKNPNDIKRIAYPLSINPKLYVIYMLRDPRDAIASRSHKKNLTGKKVWGNLRDWLYYHECAERVSEHRNFITIKYEDLVTEPDQVQEKLISQLPFLKKRCLFSEYHLQAKPSQKSDAALGGLRPISANSVGNWRKNKPFIKAQINKYGDIGAILTDLGYEKDLSWLDELKDVIADNDDEVVKHKSKFKYWKERNITLRRRQFLYRLSISPITGKLVTKIRALMRLLED